MTIFHPLFRSMRQCGVELCVAIALTAFCGLSTGCSQADDSKPVRLLRLDKTLLGDGGVTDGMRNEAETLFAVSGYGELNDSSLAAYRSNPAIRFHEHAVDSVWGNTDRLSRGLGKMKENFSRLFPGRNFPEAVTIISPFNQSVFTADSMLYIGLNHYLGEDYQPYAYFPDYIRVRKTPQRLLPDVAETLLRRDFPYAPREEYPTVLSRLLYEGALIEAEMQLAGVSEQQALGYDDTQMKWLTDHERQLWETMVGRKYLFSTDEQLAASLTGLAPFTSVIGQDVPGAAGRFIGHRIINSYLDNRAVSIADMLSPDFYESQEVLGDSKYN
ncbi:MAG: hypothetical protein K2G41_10020 [Duncaniella sp.]|uniref:gliding motility protein GldB-related protein n=1 Tax=Duncaniella sp. TaxID=2518496 RepID=UPI0023D3D0A3|nr:hypothetical protein [Duncaniella sp.]MDE6091026.1 hypothetical protein [Duncaniella sp.]